jgi:hypothetical protein
MQDKFAYVASRAAIGEKPLIFARCADGIDSIATGHWTIEFRVVFSVVCKGIRKMTTYHTQGGGR